ncbi:hypothetical protein STAFG_0277 [Streptomyces afghaniensis 772]|uniref:Uncharacterized protein n=1 Tax=Streptomyces afghaniensis 772 TaxID=1283301 RepID=S4MZH4_9ACTN|nr:hypothetical protein STAFG_0277 [Streptomyces afghaniensis 772]
MTRPYGVTFDGGDLYGAMFSGGRVHVTDAVFSGATVRFSGATVDFSSDGTGYPRGKASATAPCVSGDSTTILRRLTAQFLHQGAHALSACTSCGPQTCWISPVQRSTPATSAR